MTHHRPLTPRERARRAHGGRPIPLPPLHVRSRRWLLTKGLPETVVWRSSLVPSLMNVPRRPLHRYPQIIETSTVGTDLRPLDLRGAPAPPPGPRPRTGPDLVWFDEAHHFQETGELFPFPPGHGGEE